MSVQVRLDIDSGPRYRLAAYEIDYVGAAAPEEDLRPTLAGIGIEPGMPARAPVVVAAEQALVERLRERGHPFARVRSEEHTSELPSLMRNSYAVFCLKKKI